MKANADAASSAIPTETCSLSLLAADLAHISEVNMSREVSA